MPKKYEMKAIRFTEKEWESIKQMMQDDGYTLFGTWAKKQFEKREAIYRLQVDWAEKVRKERRALDVPLKMLE